MTVSVDIGQAGPYFPNGATVSFPFGFKILADSELELLLIDTAGVETVVNSANYTVTIAIDGEGGTATFTSPPVNDGRALWVVSNPDFTQEILFEDEGPFNSAVLNPLADHAAVRDIWLRDRLLRSFVLPFDTAARAALVGMFPVVGPGGVTTFSSGTGTDAGLRQDLALPTGSSLVGHIVPVGTAANQLAQINAIIAATPIGGVVDLHGETFTISGRPANNRGVAFYDGRILEPHPNLPAYNTLRRTYADDLGYVIGRTNLAPFFLAVARGDFQVSLSVGHSWVEQNGLYDPRAHELLQQGMYDAGIDNVTVLPLGKGGTKFTDVNVDAALLLDANLASNVHSVFLTFILNDAIDGFDAAVTHMRALVAHTRTLPNGIASKCSIIINLVGNIDGVETGQDAIIYERFRAAAIECVRDYDAVVLDTYGYLWDVKIGRNLFLDAPGFHPTGNPANGDAIPAPTNWYWRWCMAEQLFGGGGWNSRKANTNWSVSHGVQVRLVAELPTDFEFGITRWGVLTGGSELWPIAGKMTVDRHVDGVTEQTIRSIGILPRTVSRSGSGSTWTQWCGVENAITVFDGAWSAGAATPGWVVGADNFVSLFGKVGGGVTTTSAHTLLSNIRPTADRGPYPIAGGGSVEIKTNGNILITSAVTTSISLDGIRFKI